MGRFDALKTTIDANIRENGNQEITGEILNLVLNEMVSVVDDEKQDLLMDGVNIKTINGQKILGRGNITIEGGEGGGGSITLDSEMSDTSTNAVSNKVIKEYVDNAVANSGGGGGSIAVDDALSLESTNPVQNKVLTEALEGKVNKRFIYFGDSEEELNYNLETLSLLGSADAAELYTAEGMVFQFSVDANEQPCFISVSMWGLYLNYVPGISINDIYITIGSTGLVEMHTPDYTALGNPISVPSGEILNGMGSDWVNLVIENGEADWSPLPLKSIMNSNDSGSSWILPNTIKVVKESGVATGVDFYYYEAGGKGGIIRFGLDGNIQDFFLVPIAINSTDDSTSSSVIAQRKLAYNLGAEIDGCTTLKKVVSSGYHEGSGTALNCYEYTILDGTSLKVWRLWQDGYLALKSTTSLI